MKLSYTIIIFILCLASSCDTSSTEERKHIKVTSSVFDFGEILALDLDSIGHGSNYYKMVNWNEKKYLCQVNIRINGLELYDVSDSVGKLVHRIVFQKEGDQGIGELTGFYWHNQDSIFTISSNGTGNKTALVNADGEFISTIKARNRGEDFVLIANSAREIYYHNDLLYSPKEWRSTNVNDPKKHLEIKANAEYIVDITTRKEVQLSSQFPPSVGNGFMIFDRVKGHANMMVYSFFHDHNLYSLDLDFSDQQGLQAHYAGSQSGKPLEPIENNHSMDQGYMTEWVFNNLKYRGIYYDSFRHVYYRVAVQPTGYSQDPVTGKSLDDWYQLPFSIIVLDEEFNIIGEQFFPAEKYYLRGTCFINEKGFYIGANNPFNEDREEDEYRFQLLKFKKNLVKKDS